MIACIGTTPVYQRSMLFERVQINGVNRRGRCGITRPARRSTSPACCTALGEDAVVTGFAGGDRGAAMLKDLDAAGIRHDFAMVEAPTRQCVTMIDESDGSATELVEESRPVGPRIGSGCTGGSPGCCRGAGVGLFRVAAAGGGSVVLLRVPPAVRVPVSQRWSSWTRGASRCGRSLRARGFVAKMNREELAATVGRPLKTADDVASAMATILPADGAVVITGGAEGAVASDGRSFWRIEPPRVKAISAVGSGDAFAAGLAVGLLAGRSLPDACAYGAACGAANAMTALAGHLRAEDVRELKRRSA